jgi:hypothetical protein
MGQTFNVYCDESCHLEHDRQKVMVMGAIWCLTEKTREISVRLREIKRAYQMTSDFEIKWTKVSPGKVSFYKDVLDYFFDDDDLHFRALVVADKTKLQHGIFEQDHDTWYYKMYFQLLEVLFSPRDCYRIYLDRKDTCGARKVAKLHQVLCNNMYDFNRKIIERVQVVVSHEVEQIGLCDLLTGAVGYANRGLTGSSAKLALVNRLKERSGYQLTRTTLLRERKVNVFVWQPKGSVV